MQAQTCMSEHRMKTYREFLVIGIHGLPEKSRCIHTAKKIVSVLVPGENHEKSAQNARPVLAALSTVRFFDAFYVICWMSGHSRRRSFRRCAFAESTNRSDTLHPRLICVSHHAQHWKCGDVWCPQTHNLCEVCMCVGTSKVRRPVWKKMGQRIIQGKCMHRQVGNDALTLPPFLAFKL